MWLGVWRGGLDKPLSRKAEVESQSMGSDGAGWLEAGESRCILFLLNPWMGLWIFLLGMWEKKISQGASWILYLTLLVSCTDL